MIKKLMISIFALIFLWSILPANVLAQDEALIGDKEKPIVEEEKPVEEAFTPVERVDLWTENGKTTQIGPNTFSLDTSIGVINYKNDYSNNSEQWKTIDLTPTVDKDGNISVTKAPYELTIRGLEVFVKDKKTGATTTLTLSDVGEGLTSSKVSTPVLDTSVKGLATAKNIATDTDLEISWENSRIKYTRILKSSSAPVTAKYAITETGTTKIALTAQAMDSKTADDKSVEVIYKNKDGFLTETIDSKIAITYPLRVDPSLDVRIGAGNCDAYTYNNNSISVTGTGICVCYDTTYACLMRFTGISIPNKSIINNSYITFKSTGITNETGVTMRARIYAENTTNSAVFSTYANYASRTKTTSYDEWDQVEQWLTNGIYNSNSLNTSIEELMSTFSGLSSANISFFTMVTVTASYEYRQAVSYESSSTDCPLLHVEYSASCAVTGTITTATDAEIVSGGKIIVLTLYGDTWVADDGTFAGQRQNIINGISSTIGVYRNTGGTITDNGTHKFHTFTSNGTFTPSATRTIKAEAWGGGGGGGYADTFGGGGGGGGAYAATDNVSVIQNTKYKVTIGIAGDRDVYGTQRKTSSFSQKTTTDSIPLVVALGGSGTYNPLGGAGGAGASGTGTVKYSGGSGGSYNTNSDVGGGGGGAGGPNGAGVDGVNASANVHGNGGAGNNGSGGAGGTAGGQNGTDNVLGGGGGAGSGDSDGQTGGNGGVPGGGGGGTDNSAAGAKGAGGQVKVTCLMTDFTPTGTTTHAWNAEVRAKMAVGEVVRTSSTVVTITLAAQAAYAISENETMTVTIPATAVTSAVAINASPNFTIAYTSAPTHDITNDPASKAFGIVAASSTYYAKGSAPSNPVADGECTFTLTNAGSAAIDVSIKGENFTGGVGWILASSVGADNVKITAYYSGQNPASGVVLTTSDQAFISNLAASATKKWDFKFETGTFTDGVAKSTTLTLTSVAH